MSVPIRPGIPLQPGDRIGLVGGGQLGMMFAQVAKQKGYNIVLLTPNKTDPAVPYAHEVIEAEYTDRLAYLKLAQSVKVITYEFESISSEILNELENTVPVLPNPEFLHISQNRKREKDFLFSNNLPVPRFKICKSKNEIIDAIQYVGLPAVMKTTSAGYDGKGQYKIELGKDAVDLTISTWETMNCAEVIIEQWVVLKTEISVIMARDRYSKEAIYGPFENSHKNHILDVTTCPAKIADAIKQKAFQITSTIAELANVVGVFCVEFFIDQADQLYVNEIAPRPHNSGHLTIEAFTCSQFEQQLRTICGLQVGEVKQIKASAMVNVLGDLWSDGEPKWSKALQTENVFVHLYGKTEAKPGRKMGHITALADSVEEAKEIALRARLGAPTLVLRADDERSE